MDKKNLFIGLALLIAAFLSMQYFAPEAPAPIPDRAEDAAPTQPTGDESESSPQDAPSETADTVDAPEPTGDPNDATLEPESGEPSLVRRVQREQQEAALPEETVTLSNGFIEVTFTNDGGAIQKVALIERDGDKLAYPVEIGGSEPVVFNEIGKDPALGLSRPEGTGDLRPGRRLRRFQLEALNEEKMAVSFLREDADGVVIRRVYSLQPRGEESEEYVINHRSEFAYRPKAGNEDTVVPLSFFVGLGAMKPTRGTGALESLAAGVYDGNDANFFPVGEFYSSSGFLGLFGASTAAETLSENTPGARWATVKNQFFAGIFTFAAPAEEGASMPLGSRLFVDDLLLNAAETDPKLAKGLAASILVDLGELAPGQNKTLEGAYYVGPKEYRRLSALGGGQDEVMQFGWFSWISIPLLLALNLLEWGVGNWGVAIILLTVLVKAILWPLTAVQTKSAKRMQKIAGPMKELREKYKDNPQKMQKETMRLFKEHKVNPAAGCLPLLVQMPIFLGLFFMLRTASELRYSGFLWIDDLSAQDALFMLGDFPFNLLPLLMAGSMFVQMRMTPSPSADNMQRTILQFMPLVLLVFLYSFASGLVLYWTVSNLLGIFQQWLTNRSKDPDELPGAAVKPEVVEAGGGNRGKPAGAAGSRGASRPKTKARR
ncbi:MAG: membrane protein insertase YidC [Opitutales bacterium]